MKPSPEKTADGPLKGRRTPSQRNLHGAQLIIGIFLMVFSYRVARVPFHLLWDTARTTGRITDYRMDRSNQHANTLHVFGEFRLGERSVRFENWVGSKYKVFAIGDSVDVRYSLSDPTIAMIDSRVWIPFGGMFGVGVFLCLAAIQGQIRDLVK